MTNSRSFKIALVLSLLIHLCAFVALGQEQVSQRLIAPPAVAVKQQQKKPESVQFELVDTPASAEVKSPPKQTNLMSNRNTRAQDMFESEKKLKNSPHMEGKNPDVKDTRKQAIAVPQPPAPPAQPQPKAPEPAEAHPQKPAPQEQPKKQPTEKPKEAEMMLAERKPEPPRPESAKTEKKEVIQLAQKTADTAPASPSVPAPPRSAAVDITTADSRNTDANAEITGELSFAASRHFFGDYLLKMKQAVERQWVSRLVTKYTGIVSSEAVIDFKIQPDGRVTDALVHSSEGDAYFPVLCISSINDAQPFGQIPYSEAAGLPDEFLNKPLNIRFTFRYN